MKTTSIANNAHDIHFSKNELGMLRAATGGPVFINTTTRQIPAVANWKADDAKKLEQRIQKAYNNYADQSISFTKDELIYLLTIHKQNMEELDSVEYPTITGYDFSEAESLLKQIQELLK